MSRPKLILSLVALFCLGVSLPVHAQDADGQPDQRARVDEGEWEMKAQEIEVRMAELGVHEAELEMDKLRLHLETAQEQQDTRQAALIRLELKQAALRVEMRKLEAAMARLHRDRVQAELDRIRAALSEKTGKKNAEVQVEYLAELGVIVLRGAEADVEKIRAVIGEIMKEKEKKK